MEIHLRLLVYEFASGGGFADKPIPPSVLCEGYGMLRSLVSDFKAAGHQVSILLDQRIANHNFPLNADCKIIISSSQSAKDTIHKATQTCDAAYIIAPETGHTLKSLIGIVEQSGKASLNCQSSTIQKVANKAVLYETLQKAGVQTPKTVTCNISDDLEKIKSAIKNQFNYPVIFKPLNGVSCGGLSIVKSDKQISIAIEKIKAEGSCGQFLIQDLIAGETASVSLLATENEALPLSLNWQNITLSSSCEESSYNGGSVPFDHPLKQEAFAVAQKIAGLFPGLKGYFGVDVILGEKETMVVDVNPRLTTSYVGLSRVANFNVAQALLDAVLKKKLPDTFRCRGLACFEKIETVKPTHDAFSKALEMHVVSPPFPVTDSKSFALIACKADTAKSAQSRLKEVKKQYLNIINRGE